MNKYKKNLTDDDIQVLKKTMQKHDDIKSPIELTTQSIVTEHEKSLLRLMYFRFTNYENMKKKLMNAKYLINKVRYDDKLTENDKSELAKAMMILDECYNLYYTE